MLGLVCFLFVVSCWRLCRCLLSVVNCCVGWCDRLIILMLLCCLVCYWWGLVCNVW